MRAMTEKELSYQYFPFYVLTYLNDFALTALSMSAEACWLRLCAQQWNTQDGLLPADPMVVRALTKSSVQEWKRIWKELEPLFPVVAGTTGRRNDALWALRQERESFLDKQRKNGSTGGRPRKNRDETERKANAEPKENPPPKRNETQKKPSGFVSDTPMDNPTTNPTTNPLETLELVVEVTPPSPPPGGGGASPTATALRVLPGGKGNSHSPEAGDPFAGPTPIDLRELLAAVPEPQRETIESLLRVHSRPAKWAGWLAELERIRTDEAAPISWEDIGQGVRELLLVNDEGRRITLAHVETFVRAVPRRRQAQQRGPRSDMAAIVAAVLPAIDPFVEYCIGQARAGNPEFIAHCAAEGIDYQESA